MGMEIPHDLTDDLGAFPVGTVGRKPHRPHAEEHPAMSRLESIAYVRQRPADDHTHGVIHVRPAHFVFDVDGNVRLVEVCHARELCLGV